MKKIIPFKKEVVFKSHISEITSISLEHQLTINNLNINGDFIISGEYKMSDNSTTVEPFDLNIPFEIVLDEKYDTSLATCDIDDFYYEIINDSILSVSIDVCIDKLKEILIKEEIPDLRKSKDIIEELFQEETKVDEIINEISHDDCLNDNEKESESDIENSFELEKEVKQKENIITDNDSKTLYENKMEEEINGNLDCINEREEQLVDERNCLNEKIKEDKNNINIKEEMSNKINSLFNQMTEEEIYVSYNVYIIREGDTIESISEKYTISVEEIGKYNNINDLKLGDKLIIPSKI